MLRVKKKRRFVSISVEWCHICGLPIPGDIASSKHPLFGTVDHVIPRSRGGSNRLDNRRAAHRLCNSIKGNLDLSEHQRETIRVQVQILLNRAGEVCGPSLMKRARKRCVPEAVGGRPDTPEAQNDGGVAKE